MELSQCLTNNRIFVIAEIGQNHNGDMNIAKRLIKEAASAGFDAIKSVKRDINSELTTEAYNKPYDNPNSFGKTYGEHREYLELTVEKHKELKKYSNKLGLMYFCSACDTKSVDDMEKIDVDIYKIASRDLTNIPLIEYIAKLNKTIILSTGMASYKEIDEAVDMIRKFHNKIIILQCTSQYPTPIENINLRVIPNLMDRYNVPVGLSDHNSGILPATLAVVLGASVIEKHVTLSRAMKGTDQAGSLEIPGMRKLISYIRNAQLALGNEEKIILEETVYARRKLERSIVSNKFINKGEILYENMIVLKSPGTGLRWNEKHRIIGKKAKRNIKKDCLLTVDDFV